MIHWASRGGVVGCAVGLFGSMSVRLAATIVVLLGLSITGCAGDEEGPSTSFEALPTAAIRPSSLADGRLAMSAYPLTGNEKDDETWEMALTWCLLSYSDRIRSVPRGAYERPKRS